MAKTELLMDDEVFDLDKPAERLLRIQRSLDAGTQQRSLPNDET